MSRTLRHPNRQTGRCRPRLERLEGRLALSMGAGPVLPPSISAPPVSAFETTEPPELGPYLQPVDTGPASGSVLYGPVSTVSVGFDRPLDANNLMFEDVVIEREEDGGWVRAYDPSTPPFESLDDTGTRLVLTLDAPLGPGHYRLVLPTGSFLMGSDGSMIDDPGSDQVLGDFTIVRPGATLTDAEALPDPTAGAVLEAWGALDLADDPGAVRLYRVELPEGHHWRLGVQVDAGSLGSSLLSTLALFDAEGRVLSTSTVGRPAAPKDPYLFAGLAPGTYYLGLSGHGNLPGQAGGYDPATGLRGTSDRPDLGGAFRLQVVADPADAPTRLLDFQLDRADPRSTVPTGMTLGFSGPLDLNALRGSPCPGLVLLGPDGRPVPMTAVRLDEATARYGFVFDQALAPGRYTVRLADEAGAGLTDLAGWRPVAPGEPEGVLASFTVEGVGPTARDPRDLGPLYGDFHDGRDSLETIAPGTAVSFRFVALTEGHYVFSTLPTSAGAELVLRIHGPNGASTLDVSPPAQPMVYLKPGPYLVQLVNVGSGPVTTGWEFHLNTPRDALLDNGIGQTPALSLRLVRPDSAPGLAAPAVEASGPSWARSNVVMGPASGQFAGASDVIEPTATGAAPVDRGGAPLTTAGLVLAPVSEAVGRPSTTAGTAAGPVALSARGGPGSQGLLGGQDLARRGPRPRTTDEVEAEAPPVPAPGEEVAEGRPAPVEDRAPVNGPMVAEAPGQAKGDALVIATAEWLARVQESAMAFLTSQPAEAPDVDVLPVPPAEDAESARGDGRHESGEVEQATLDAPLTVAVASVLAMRYHQPMLGWLRRRRSGPAGRPGAGSITRFRGPHRRR